MMKIKVGGREIGEGAKPFVISEIGSNIRDFDDVKISIQAAANSGADAVKFQLFTNKSLFGHGSDIPLLSPLWLPIMKSQCDELGIEFMCSAFSPELYDVINPFVNIHKVASAEISHVRILQKLNKLGKPVILSTGASGLYDITTAITYLTDVPLFLLYCVASYPAREIDLNMIKIMQGAFGLPVGFSDHSTDVLVIPSQAVKEGACIIEKHMTAIDEETPDKHHSITPSQFRSMVKRINNEEVYDLTFGATFEEIAMVTTHNRRLLAIKDINIGDEFIEGLNFGIYRSLKPESKGLTPFVIDKVVGRKSNSNIKAGQGIGPEDIRN
jgi:N-acetylneuraminate synthase